MLRGLSVGNTNIPLRDENLAPTAAPKEGEEEEEPNFWIIFSIPFLCLCFFTWGLLCAKGLLAAPIPQTPDEEDDNVEIPRIPRHNKKLLRAKLHEFLDRHFEASEKVSTYEVQSTAASIANSDPERNASDDTLGNEALQFEKEKDTQQQQCAVCLEEYHAGDSLVSSTSSQCNHFFHKDCLLPCLTSSVVQKVMAMDHADDDAETLWTKHMTCPCCRQEFCNLSSKEAEQLSEIIMTSTTNIETQQQEEELLQSIIERRRA